MKWRKYERGEVMELTQKVMQWRHYVDCLSMGKDESAVCILRTVIANNAYLYYMENDPLITDYDFDMLLKYLKDLEEEHPDLRTDDSPSMVIGAGAYDVE